MLELTTEHALLNDHAIIHYAINDHTIDEPFWSVPHLMGYPCGSLWPLLPLSYQFQEQV